MKDFPRMGILQGLGVGIVLGFGFKVGFALHQTIVLLFTLLLGSGGLR